MPLIPDGTFQNQSSSNSCERDDTRVVADVLNGDVNAYAILVLRYQDRIFRTVVALVGDSDEAEDIAQEIFVKAYASLHRFRGQSQFYTWLYRIAVNRCLDHIKSRNRRVMVRDENGELDAAVLSLDLPSGDSTDARMTQMELQSVLETALKQLPEEYRVTFVMREIDGLTYDEISELLGCSVGTVKSRLFRARSRLQNLLRSFYLTWFER